MLDTVKINHVQHISFTQSRLTDAVSVILSELLSYEHPPKGREFFCPEVVRRRAPRGALPAPMEGECKMDYTALAAAAMSLIGTLAGTFGGILVAGKLTTYRIDQLEKKVGEHNKLVERTYKLEGQMVELQHDIRDLKAERG